MTREDKLLSLLHPKNYVSKIKLFCKDCILGHVKINSNEMKPHKNIIKITEL